MDILNQKKPKAKKDHTCNWCCGTIKKGEHYDFATCVYDGEIYTWKNHFKCMEIATELKMFGECPDGVTECDFNEFIYDEFGKYIDDEKHEDKDYSTEEMVDIIMSSKKAATDVS
ncbi:MAG TPA: hypothetical protein VFM70_09660 [Salinimicrobium sp.]|nr:hypothetical protein [Salinimicrobium sp.]